MEILLLLVVIVLLAVFNSSKNSQIRGLEQKLSIIESYLKSLQLNQQRANSQSQTAETVQKAAAVIVPPVISPKKEEEKKTDAPVREVVTPVQQEAQKTLQPEPVQQRQHVRPAPRPVKQSWYESFRKNNPDLEKFIGENILSKIAIVILVLGIGFFVKYAIDQDWINEWARVGIGMLSGGIVLGFAHYLHKKFKAFSSVLVAGGISVFYFTIGIGFHQYQLFSQPAAFAIMLFITGASVVFSLAYDRVELAALSLVGGFSTPFMVSSGSGNYQVLFCYVLILDIGMLVLAYLRKWNLINILAYCFTELLYFSWLESRVIGHPGAPYAGALLFGATFYLIFILMNVVNNVRARRSFGTPEISILISNTFLFYGSGMQVLASYHPQLKGLFNVGLALFNMACAWLLYKRFKADLKLVYLMIGLTLTFTTLVAPIQLEGNYITLFWALEGLLLMWLAQRSGMVLYRFVSMVVTVLTLISLLGDWINIYGGIVAAPVIFNKAFISGLTAALSVLATSWLLRKEQQKLSYMRLSFHPQNYALVLKTGGIALLYLTGLLELIYQLHQKIDQQPATYILCYCYHLLFVSALNFSNASDMRREKALYVINYASCLVFLVGFALLPVFDFKENSIASPPYYAGFVFHYLSVAGFLFLVYKLRKAIQRPDSNLATDAVLNTMLLSAGFVYLCSIELTLHVLQVRSPYTAPGSPEQRIVLLEVYKATCTQVSKIGFPILWGFLSFIFLFAGMRKQNRTLRLVALALIAVTLLKLFIFDIRHASEAGKIIAFIILGVLLLIISFMYQKIKALLLDDEKAPHTEPNEN